MPTFDYHTFQDAPKPRGMLVFGIVFCLLAVASACFAGLTPLALLAPPPPPPPPPTAANAASAPFSAAMLISAIVIYIVAAAGFVVLAVGCFRNRRWLPVVALALAWPTLIAGLIYIPIVAISAALTPLPPGTPAFATTAAVIGIVVFGLLFAIGFPMAMVLYFRRLTLHQALAFRQPDAGYVARQSPRMVGLWLWPMVLAVTFLATLARPIIAVFGTILTGYAAAAILIVLAGTMLLAAHFVYRGNRIGVWLLAGVTVLTSSSYIVTSLLLGGDATVMLTVDPSQHASMQGNPMLNTPMQVAVNSGYGLLVLVAILWAGRAVGPIEADVVG